jgi:hypothetical protein
MMPPSLLNKVTKELHAVPVEVMRQLPEALADPVAVFQSRTEPDALVVLTEFKENGNPVIAAVHLNVSGANALVVNRITSVYGKSRTTVADMFHESPLYINNEKYRGWARTAGVQSPGVRISPSRQSKAATPEDVVKFASGLQTAKAVPSTSPPAEPKGSDTGGAKPGGENSFNLTPNSQPDTIHHDPNGPKAPRRAFREITGDDGRSTGADGEKRRKPGRRVASSEDLARWAGKTDKTVDPEIFTGEGALIGGGEHTIFYNGGNRVLKFTKPGLFGAQAEDAGAYLQRWALHNEVFNDDVQIEGIVTLPGEHAPRLVISQPFRKGRDATPAEIADYLTEKGFTEHEGRWVHPVRGVAVWDTITAGNVIMTEHGARAVDLQIGPAGPAELHAVRERTGIGRKTSFSLQSAGGDTPPSRPARWPLFLEPAAPADKMHPNEHTPPHRQTWDPRSLQEALRGNHQRGAGPAHGETRGDRSREGAQPAPPRLIADLPGYDGAKFAKDTEKLTWLHGEEHDVYLDPATGLAIKLTQPGATGKGTSWSEYLHRLALSNELLGDAVEVAGRIRFPGEKGDRVITFQPLRMPHPDRPTPTNAEIDAFMKQRGFEKAYDGVWLHRGKDMIATDALPKNFIRDAHAIDLQFREPSDRETSGFNRDRIEAMIRNSAGR